MFGRAGGAASAGAARQGGRERPRLRSGGPVRIGLILRRGGARPPASPRRRPRAGRRGRPAPPPATSRTEPCRSGPPFRGSSHATVKRPAAPARSSSAGAALRQVHEVDLAPLREARSGCCPRRRCRRGRRRAPSRGTGCARRGRSRARRREVPRALAAAPVLAEEVVLRQRVAEVVLDAGAAGHQRAPQGVAADVVEVVLAAAPSPSRPCRRSPRSRGRAARRGRRRPARRSPPPRASRPAPTRAATSARAGAPRPSGSGATRR